MKDALMLRKPRPRDREAIEVLYQRSARLHRPWTYPPQSIDHYLQQPGRYFLCLADTDAIVGTFNISGLMRGWFQSAHLGYEVFEPYQGRGYMSEGLRLLLAEAFGPWNLHRLEANIQPGNTASIKLVARAGFVKEGFSRQFLRIGGREWKDHERWAILNCDWDETAAPPRI